MIGFRRLLSIAALGAAALGPVLAAEPSGYAHPEMLVETAWVAAHAGDRDVRIIDMRGAAAYAAGHIPGAVRLEEGPLRNTGDRLTYLPRPEELARMMGQAGISGSTRVVAYDDAAGRPASRLWYVLNAYGHTNVSIVNGGWTKWTAEGRPVSRSAPSVSPVTFTPRLVPRLTCVASELLARKPNVVVLDTRSEREFAAGRIPKAVRVDWVENVSGPHQTFKSAAELRKVYESKGVTRDKEIVPY